MRKENCGFSKHGRLCKQGKLRPFCYCGRFEPSSVTINVTELYEETTYFASAVFRGLELDVRNALVMLYHDEMNPLSHKTDLGDGVSLR